MKSRHPDTGPPGSKNVEPAGRQPSGPNQRQRNPGNKTASPFGSQARGLVPLSHHQAFVPGLVKLESALPLDAWHWLLWMIGQQGGCR